MNSNVIVFAWNRSVVGRESMSGQHFRDFTEYLSAQQQQGAIESFETVLLEPHGGTLNGLFLLRGEPDKLAKLVGTEDWTRHQVRAVLHLEGAAVLRGVAGTAVGKQMAMWMQEIPK